MIVSSQVEPLTDNLTVSTPPSRSLSRRVPRLLPWRHVLFANICHGCTQFPFSFLNHFPNTNISLLQNLELFFCVYARNWNGIEQCNSSHSRLLGFFTTLPGIWRAIQCLRRYRDTRNAFPHLVNCGKYTFTILFYMTLSLYRINQIPSLKALFITCATINSIYCSKSPSFPHFPLDANKNHHTDPHTQQSGI